MLAESKELEFQINSLQTQLREYPDGKLICARNGSYSKWYISDGKTCTYIPKKDRAFASNGQMKLLNKIQYIRNNSL